MDWTSAAFPHSNHYSVLETWILLWFNAKTFCSFSFFCWTSLYHNAHVSSILQIRLLTLIISSLSLLKTTSGWKQTTILTEIPWTNRKREAGQTPSCATEEKDWAEEWTWATAGSLLNGVSRKAVTPGSPWVTCP